MVVLTTFQCFRGETTHQNGGKSSPDVPLIIRIAGEVNVRRNNNRDISPHLTTPCTYNVPADGLGLLSSWPYSAGTGRCGEYLLGLKGV